MNAYFRDPSTTQQSTSWALFILTFLLMMALWTSYYLQLKKIKAIHETIISIFLGMIVGLLIRLFHGTIIQKMVTFHYTYFFNLLLPPIILNSGYELHQELFFKNIGIIFTFAFAGTFISAIVIGLLTYLWTLTGIEHINISQIDALKFGATLSATDPVTILAIFHTYGVDPTLYTIIFGESLLNDSVSIVMFGTLQQFYNKEMNIIDIFVGIGGFFIVFIISLIIGTLVGILTALILKHSSLRRFPHIESCIITLMAYASYLFSNACHMSGIVSLLFCSITLKHYAFHNMSIRTQLSTKFLFKSLSQLSENFMFVYLGISLFTQTNFVFKPILIFVTMVSVCIARYMAVFPISKIINVILRSSNMVFSDGLPKSYQIMLFWSGLRGAVGVALVEGFNGEAANIIKATVLVVVVLTVIIFGGTTAQILEIVGVRIDIIHYNEEDDYHIEHFCNRNIMLEDNVSDTIQYRKKDSYLSHTQKMNQCNNESHQYSKPIDSVELAYHSDQSSKNLEQSDDDDSDQISSYPETFFPSDLKSVKPSENTSYTIPSYEMNQGEATTSQARRSTLNDHMKWFKDFNSKILKPLILEKDIFAKENDEENQKRQF